MLALQRLFQQITQNKTLIKNDNKTKMAWEVKSNALPCAKRTIRQQRPKVYRKTNGRVKYG